MDSALRRLPAVHRLLDEPRFAAFGERLGSLAVKVAVTDVLDDVRRCAVRDASVPSYEALVGRIAERLAREEADGLLPVINATGILLHTNLGRAPLAREAAEAAAAIAGGYSNIEFDLGDGVRGSRYDRVTRLVRETTGAADVVIVNNCAAAMLLILDTFAKDREVIVARNELIEIGGGFRLPDVLARSGARLVEVGTTNKVYLFDFERALTVETALFLRNHRSNFRIEGFVADVEPAALAALGRRAGVPVVEDLGTGALVDLAAYGLPHERTVREAISDGLDLVAFSADKLLGGPQAGVIAGNPSSIARLRNNPLLRALRVDKSTLAALGATLALYALPGGVERIPLYAMLAIPLDALEARAQHLREALAGASIAVEVTATTGFVGGGTLPQTTVASVGIAIASATLTPDHIAARLRRARPAVVGRIADHRFIIDLRTVPAVADAHIAAALTAALGSDRT